MGLPTVHDRVAAIEEHMLDTDKPAIFRHYVGVWTWAVCDALQAKYPSLTVGVPCPGYVEITRHFTTATAPAVIPPPTPTTMTTTTAKALLKISDEAQERIAVTYGPLVIPRIERELVTAAEKGYRGVRFYFAEGELPPMEFYTLTDGLCGFKYTKWDGGSRNRRVDGGAPEFTDHCFVNFAFTSGAVSNLFIVPYLVDKYFERVVPLATTPSIEQPAQSSSIAAIRELLPLVPQGQKAVAYPVPNYLVASQVLYEHSTPTSEWSVSLSTIGYGLIVLNFARK